MRPRMCSTLSASVACIKLSVLLSLDALILQVATVAEAYQDLRINEAVDAALAVPGRGNQYINEREPWTAFKKVC